MGELLTFDSSDRPVMTLGNWLSHSVRSACEKKKKDSLEVYVCVLTYMYACLGGGGGVFRYLSGGI